MLLSSTLRRISRVITVYHGLSISVKDDMAAVGAAHRGMVIARFVPFNMGQEDLLSSI